MSEPDKPATVPSVDDIVHTPGPWEIVDVVYGQGPEESRVESYFVIGTQADKYGEHEHICQVRCPQTWGAGAYHYDVDKTRSIAKLIAAAPELLAAIRDFLGNACRPNDNGKYDDMFDESRKRLRQAIEKAEGREVV